MKSASVQKTRLWLTPNAAWGFYSRSPIAHGCAFHPCAIGDPRGRAAVRARSGAAVRATRMHPGVLGKQALRALRANRVSGTDEKHIRTRNTVMVKPKAVWIGFYARSKLCNNGGRDF